MIQYVKDDGVSSKRHNSSLLRDELRLMTYMQLYFYMCQIQVFIVDCVFSIHLKILPLDEDDNALKDY